MKESVTELLQLVGGNRQSSATKTSATLLRNKEVRLAAPAAKRSATIRGNGQAHAATANAGATNGRKGIPLEDDFKDF